MMKPIRIACLVFPAVLLPLVHVFLAVLSDEGAAEIVPRTLALVLFAAVLFAAVCEELFFRSFLQNELKEIFSLHPLTAVLVVNFLFAGLHAVNFFSYATFSYSLWQIILAFAVGISLSAVYERIDQIGYCIAIHALINGTGLLVGFSVTEGRAFVYGLTALAYVAYGFWLLRRG